MKSVALISLGCAKNLVDSEVMLGYLDKANYTLVTRPEKADVIIVNTCGFIQPARKEAIDSLRQAIALKRKEGQKIIVAAGCYVERNRKSLEKKFPEVDVWIGVKDFDKIVQVVEGKPFFGSSDSFLYDHSSPRLLSTPSAWAFVKISEGCSHQCAFCSIPSIKGPYRSRTISSVVLEVEELVARGVKEINLISQDSTYFGRDLDLEDGLLRLLIELLSIRKLEWIRILYGYPEEIGDSLLEVLQEDKICSYLDIPFQHSDPKIIRRMRRGLDGRRTLKLLRKIRHRLPDVAIRTSLVVGFPGEGRIEFENLRNFVREARFDHLGVFVYSREEGTDCYSFGDPVKETVKKRRKENILELQAEISFQNNEKYLNRQIDVLIEGHLKKDPLTLVGRGRFQAPEVDGIVFIDADGKETGVVNEVQKIEIIDRDVYDLYGKIIR